MVENGNNFILYVDESNIEELLEGIPGELDNDKLLKLEKKSIDEEEAREKDISGKEKEEEPLRKFTIRCLIKGLRSVCRL